MKCMVRLQKCQDQGLRNCHKVEHCLNQEAVVAEPDENNLHNHGESLLSILVWWGDENI